MSLELNTYNDMGFELKDGLSLQNCKLVKISDSACGPTRRRPPSPLHARTQTVRNRVQWLTSRTASPPY
jgi:hypothetical protein